MANQPATSYAAEHLRNEPSLGVGVHLTLSDGAPVLSPDCLPSLVDRSGKFFTWWRVVQRLWRLRVSSREIEAEFRAQIRRIRELGINPTHADSHHHIHLHPFVARPFYRALRAEGIERVRSPRRRVFLANNLRMPPHQDPWYRRGLLAVYTAFLQGFVFCRLRCPDSTVFSHAYSQQNPGTLADGWMDSLRNLPPGTYELCCHPGLSEQGFSEYDGYRERREAELQILTSMQFRQLVEGSRIQLINYGAL